MHFRDAEDINSGNIRVSAYLKQKFERSLHPICEQSGHKKAAIQYKRTKKSNLDLFLFQWNQK